MKPLDRRTQSSLTNNLRPTLALCLSLTLGLGLLILGLNLPRVASAAEPKEASGQESNPNIGLVSSVAACLAVGDDLPGQPSGVVRLDWQGQVERARLILSVAGSAAAHTIKVNGQPAARVPVSPGGQPCAAEEYFYLDVAPDLLAQGDNLIEITNDAQADDSWTAAQVRLVVFGHLDAADSSQVGPAEVSIAATTYVLTFTNPYDATSQEFMAQIPDGYDPGDPTPLLIFVHGRSSSMAEGIDAFGSATNARGWLLASPELHGHWTGDPPPPTPGYYAYASLESQYDVVGAMNYMLDHYNVITSQIYLVGYSMGGQIATITIAKFPHVFAAVFDNKGPTDMAVWYEEQAAYYESYNSDQVRAMRRECHINLVEQNPTQNPFCYARRSGIRFARNYAHIPISITHSVGDLLVPIHHSHDLRDDINAYDPDWEAALYEDTSPPCGAPYHCYEPDPTAVLNFLEPFTLNNTPTRLNVASDESKNFYWLNLGQTGGDHWSHVEATYYPVTATVTAVVSDTHLLDVAFNLGATALPSKAVTDKLKQPGMGLPATTYLVKGGGNNYLYDYTSGYLTTSLLTTGQFALTVSAIEVQVSANPAMVKGGQTTSSNVTAVVRDQLGNAAPNGATIQFSTTEGTWPNASSIYVTTIAGGQAVATLTLGPTANLAHITASVESVTGATSVDVIHPALELLITSHSPAVYKGDTVTYTYQLTNTGDITLANVTLVDDNGTPGNSGDDFTVCEYTTLSAGATKSCSRSTTLNRTTTNTAVVAGRDPLNNTVTDSDAVTVEIIAYNIYLPVVIKNR